MNAVGQLAGMRVLVVEDDYYLAADQRDLLRKAGADVVGPCGNVEDATRLIAAERIDCALVDINLGDGPCFALARRLREESIPFLFTTGYDAGAIPADLRDVRRFEKPTDEQMIVTALSEIARVSHPRPTPPPAR